MLHRSALIKDTTISEYTSLQYAGHHWAAALHALSWSYRRPYDVEGSQKAQFMTECLTECLTLWQAPYGHQCLRVRLTANRIRWFTPNGLKVTLPSIIAAIEHNIHLSSE